MIDLNNQDCLEAMRQMADNQFDLAIVDPPYGIGAAKKPIEAGKWKRKIHKSKDWDSSIPPKEYFQELKRVSKNQVIWGGNYFLDYLTNTPCFIVWDKKLTKGWLADCELAWTSFNTQTKIFTRHHIEDHNAGIKRIHPTQKPVKLYEWLLDNYAKEGDKILDTHLGSGSIALACHNRGFDLTAFEIDKEYFEAAKKRLEIHQAQLTMF
jgi:site-specific DNA-methyltransferase (adenine-specific)